MLKIDIQKRIIFKRVLYHVVFWLVVFLFNLFLYSYSTGHYRQTSLSLLITMPFDILATYLTIYLLIPKYLLKKKYISFALFFIISVVFFVMIERMLNVYFIYIYIYDMPSGKYPFWSVGIVSLAISIYTIVALVVVLKLIKIWYVNQQLQNELENQNLHSELAQLRNQINPHFLFNTLNNIHTLISKDKKKASDAIIKLSDIMRFMLYDANAEKIPLDKEIEYLKSYISLQQIRLKNNDFVKFTVDGANKTLLIPPMLFISFIENAFKHGLKKGTVPGIIINFFIEKQYVKFECINYFVNNKTNKDKTEGIGLNNIKRRLELIYPNRHKLIIIKTGGRFVAKLELEI